MQFDRTYVARPATSEADIAASIALRTRVFRPSFVGPDRDVYDAECVHMLVERTADGSLAACFRYMIVTPEAAPHVSYSAQFYELSALSAFGAPLIEIGRFCVTPGLCDADILRCAWGALARVVVAEGAGFLFGCSSFEGTDAGPYRDAFEILRDRHLAPLRWLPRAKAPQVVAFARHREGRADPKAAMRAMPSLLKSYLAMGGWVSDHAVIDRDLGTLHVFTGVEVDAIPPARRRSLLAGA